MAETDPIAIQRYTEHTHTTLAHIMTMECSLGLARFSESGIALSLISFLFPSYHRSHYFRDDQIRSKCGDDAVQYLSFQRHLIVLMFIITVTSLCIALPINMQGDLKGDTKQFGHTTLSNLDPKYLNKHNLNDKSCRRKFFC